MRSIVNETCRAIWTALVDEFMSIPNEDDWRNKEKEFHEKWNFPNCVGAIDGKHVVLQAPPSSGSLYFNYKNSHSIVLMAMVDASYKFVFVDIGAYGRNSDSGVLSHSQFGQALLNNELRIPEPKILPGSDVLVPHVVVADGAFPLRSNLLRPYTGNLNDSQRVFNYRLSRARRVTENAFGILAQRWRIFLRQIHHKPENAETIVKACCILHNFLIQKNSEEYVTVENENIENVWDDVNSAHGVRNSTKNAQAVRDKFAGYFVSNAGQVPWQWSIACRGL